jgi:hypothetical protein
MRKSHLKYFTNNMLHVLYRVRETYSLCNFFASSLLDIDLYILHVHVLVGHHPQKPIANHHTILREGLLGFSVKWNHKQSSTYVHHDH